ncbi:2-hydroxy-3-oxopropionate reductase [Paenibacillus radicis (ex Xue et al. 2023)]|uniref:2-hydroxy-3-oxopropionate reductase n=1 Tax=Paenibacillus radicis (ex Xue et al. 2023) TaxID=2972489 RepID=A0ABT1YTI4_9BACL|nr:2-hydroxy-3-oxopropionate reductase [Paenibacillus radicis (ex Xue et al. 2023)]MCR8635295.1 2-hydroxy-3-oxopropionate reductase [Paenibacillus radicis (ex Xue et al. 2023)]
MKVGFIGLGIMGKPMAKHIIKAGYSLNVYNRSQASIEELASLGAHSLLSPKEVAEQSDVVITMLPDSPQVQEVITGFNGVADGISAGKIVVDMSSIDPGTARSTAEVIARKGGSMLDAPVSGGEIGAIEGKLSIMVGGDAAVFQQALPLLQTMGKSVTLVGEIGAGNTVKLMNQMIVAVNLAAVSEAFAFGRKAGVDLETAYQAIKGGLAGSRVMDTKKDNMISESFQPGFRIDLHRKDLNNALRMGYDTGASLQLTELMAEQLNALSREGYGSEDHSALYRWYARLGIETVAD